MSQRPGKQRDRAVESPAEPEGDASELPEGWASSALGDVTHNISYGYTAKASSPNVGPKYLRITDIQDGAVKWDTVPYCEIEDDRIKNYRLSAGDLVFARTGATTGKSFLIKDCPEAVFASYLIRVRPSAALLPEFVAAFFQTSDYWGQISDNITGSAQPNCNASKLASLVVPIAPLAEQRRIVAKLEELLGKVSSSQQRLSRVPGLLKRFRKSVLAAACSGRLTADWRDENEASRAELPNEIEVPADFPPLPETWSWTILESVCEKVVDCPHSTPIWTDAGKLCIRTTNFRPGLLDLSEVRFVSVETFNERIERLRPKPGDIVYSREGGILGIACQIPSGVELCLGQRMMLFRVRSDFNATLLMHWLNNPVITHRVQELTGGSASPHLNVRDIKSFPTPFPPLAEQQEIVRRVEKLFAFADQIEARLTQAQTHVDRLTQSLLRKAFRGELVPPEATLARREARDYESADELLAKIRSLANPREAVSKRRTRER